MSVPVLVVNHVRSGVAALNVVAAALPARWEVLYAGPGSLAGAIEAVEARGDRPVVAWSFYSTDFEGAARELAALSASRALHIAGGVHTTADPESVLRAGFDIACIGEGESTIGQLFAALEARTELREVPGIALLQNGRVFRSPGAPRMPLDRFPAFHAAARKFNPIEITRGCVYACSFCQTPYAFKARFRHRSVENVAEHVAQMAAAGLPYVRFVSPTSLSYGSADTSVNLGAVEALLRAVREAFGPERQVYFGTFPSEVRPEHVTPEALALLAQYVDNRSLIIGAQSGSERVLEATHRGHDVAAVVRAVELCIAGGFRPDVDFLFGLPGEEHVDRLASVALADRLVALGARIHTHSFLPLPGTPLAGAAPATLEPDIAAHITRWEAAGRSFGQWRRQEVQGRELAARHAERPGR